MILFERITLENISIVLEVINSNPVYNLNENGQSSRSLKEIQNEFLGPETESFLVKNEDGFIGVIDFLHKNPNDGFPWLGLLMVHRDCQTKGIGRSIFHEFEKLLIKRSIDTLRLGVLQSNPSAKKFWITVGFTYVCTKSWNDKPVDVMEKALKLESTCL